MFHLLAGEISGVEVCGLGVAWGVSGLWSEESEVGSELVASGSSVGVGGLRLVWTIWIGSASRADLYAFCWWALSVSSSVWVGVVLELWVKGEGGAVGDVVVVWKSRGSVYSGSRGGVWGGSGGVIVGVDADRVGSWWGVEVSVVWGRSVCDKRVEVGRVRSMMGNEGGVVVGVRHVQLSCVVWHMKLAGAGM